MATSQDGFLIDVLAVMFTAALGLAAIYVVIGIALLPVWALGAVLRVDVLRRAGESWLLPLVIRETGESWIERFTAPRDGSRWKRPEPTARPDGDVDRPGDWARDLGLLVLWAL